MASNSIMINHAPVTRAGTASVMIGIFSAGYVIGGIGLEILNILTTFLIFDALFAWVVPIYGDLARVIFSVSMTGFFALSDIGGIARLTTPSTGPAYEPKYVWVLFGVWMVIGVGNALLTYMFFSDTLYFSVSSIQMSPNSLTLLQHAPVALSIIVYLVRVMNMLMLGAILDGWIHGSTGIPLFNKVKKVNNWLNNSPSAPAQQGSTNRTSGPAPAPQLANNRAQAAQQAYQHNGNRPSLNRNTGNGARSYSASIPNTRPVVQQVPLDVEP